MTCQDFLKYIISINQVPNYFCQANVLGSTCCQSCIKYNAMKCVDSYYDCPKYKSGCKTFTINGQPLSSLCQRTCGTCTDTALTCAASLCQNGANCQSLTSSTDSTNSNYYSAFTCNCAPGFSGELCQTKNPCLPNPCSNTGVCTNVGSLGYLCTCAPGFSGQNCTATTGSTASATQATNVPTLSASSVSTVSSSTVSTVSSSTVSATSGTTGVPTTSCRNVNDLTCAFYFNIGVKCSSVSYVGNLIFSQYCCGSCFAPLQTTITAQTTTVATTSTSATTTLSGSCTNANDNSCSFYLSLGVKCNSGTYVNAIPFSQYCCKSCTSPQTTTTTTTVSGCTNVNDNSCAVYLNLGVKCGSASYVNAIPFSQYCCKSCSNIQITTTPTTTTKTTAPSNGCLNVNDSNCNYYISVGVKCASSYIGGVPFSIYCCKSCNGGK